MKLRSRFIIAAAMMAALALGIFVTASSVAASGGPPVYPVCFTVLGDPGIEGPFWNPEEVWASNLVRSQNEDGSFGTAPGVTQLPSCPPVEPPSPEVEGPLFPPDEEVMAQLSCSQMRLELTEIQTTYVRIWSLVGGEWIAVRGPDASSVEVTKVWSFTESEIQACKPETDHIQELSGWQGDEPTCQVRTVTQLMHVIKTPYVLSQNGSQWLPLGEPREGTMSRTVHFPEDRLHECDDPQEGDSVKEMSISDYGQVDCSTGMIETRAIWMIAYWTRNEGGELVLSKFEPLDPQDEGVKDVRHVPADQLAELCKEDGNGGVIEPKPGNGDNTAPAPVGHAPVTNLPNTGSGIDTSSGNIIAAVAAMAAAVAAYAVYRYRRA